MSTETGPVAASSGGPPEYERARLYGRTIYREFESGVGMYKYFISAGDRRQDYVPTDGGIRHLQWTKVTGEEIRDEIKALKENLGMGDAATGTHSYLVGDPLNVVFNAAGLASVTTGSMEAAAIVTAASAPKFLSASISISGTITVEQSVKIIDMAGRLKDIEGGALGVIRFIRGCIEILTGVVFFGFRVVSVLNLRNVHMGITPQAVGGSAIGIGSALYALIAIPFFVIGIRSAQFWSKIRRAQEQFKHTPTGGVFETFQEIAQAIELTDTEVHDILTEVEKRKENEAPPLTSEETNVLSKPDRDRVQLPDNEQRWFFKLCALEKMKKMNIFIRNVDEDCYTYIHTLLSAHTMQEVANKWNTSLYDIHKGKQREIKEIVAEIVEGTRLRAGKKAIFYLVIAITCLIAITALLGSFLFPIGSLALIGFISGLISAVVMLGVDAVYFVNAMRNVKHKPNAKDNVKWGILILLNIMTIVVGCIFAPSMAAFGICLAVGLLVLAMQVTAYIYAYVKKHGQEENGPKKIDLSFMRDNHDANTGNAAAFRDIFRYVRAFVTL